MGSNGLTLSVVGSTVIILSVVGPLQSETHDLSKWILLVRVWRWKMWLTCGGREVCNSVCNPSANLFGRSFHCSRKLLLGQEVQVWVQSGRWRWWRSERREFLVVQGWKRGDFRLHGWHMLLPSSILLDTNLNLKYVKTRNTVCLWMLQQVWPVWQQLLCRVLQHLGEHETDSSGFTTRQYSNLPTALHCTASLYHSPNGTLLGRSPKKGCLYQDQRGSSLQCIGMFLWRLSLYLPLLDHK